MTDANGSTIQYAYDELNRLAGIDYPAPEVDVSYTYDDAGQRSSMTDGQGTTYNTAGRVNVRTLGADVLRTDYNYFAWTDANGWGRLSKIMSGTPADTDSLQDLRYTYDALGNVLTIKDYKAGNPQTQTFTYDALNRLASAVASGGTGGTYASQSYTYHSTTGNLSAKAGVSYTYGDSSHQHAVTLRSDGSSFQYDNNGNMTQRVIGGSTYNLTYDYENRLTGVSGAVSATFVYDGDGNRVKGTVGGNTIAYIGSHFEFVSSTSTMKKYYYAGGVRIAMRTNTYNPKYLMGDHLGSTAIIANYDGAFYGEKRYMPWGEERWASGTIPTTYLYTGQREQAELGLYFYNARWYDPALGRFLSADSIVPNPYDSQAWDRYAYARNAPIRYIDPTGHRTCTDEQTATGDETCDQNYDIEELIQSLSFFYGWTVVGDWSLDQIVTLVSSGKDIRDYIQNTTGGDGNAWIKKYMGNAVFHHGNDIRSFVFPSSDAYLRNGEERYWVVHELGHVLDNNLKGGGAPATFLGGGPADAMLKFVGGQPENCFPRFQCSRGYIANVAGPEHWEIGEYGNNSVADDFAQTFAKMITGGTAPPLRSMWMKAFLSVLTSYVP